jgi:hypothetical protein
MGHLFWFEMGMITTEQSWKLIGATERDLAYLYSLGVGLAVDTDSYRCQRLTDSSGYSIQYRSNQVEVTVTTTCKKTSLLLQLKYGSNLILHSTTHTAHLV